MTKIDRDPKAVKRALEDAGANFIDREEGVGGPGVRFKEDN